MSKFIQEAQAVHLQSRKRNLEDHIEELKLELGVNQQNLTKVPRANPAEPFSNWTFSFRGSAQARAEQQHRQRLTVFDEVSSRCQAAQAETFRLRRRLRSLRRKRRPWK